MTKDMQFYSASYASELSFKNKLGRFIWNLTWCLFFRQTPRPFFGWRRFLLGLFGAKLDATAVVYPSARIWAPWNLEMHAGSVLGDYVDCYSVDQVTLEAEVTVSQYAFLCTASHDIESPERSLVTAPITVKQGAWVFAGAFVGMGITIGEGSVVAARSVVVKDVEPFAVVGGNPAKKLKTREVKWLNRELNKPL